MTLFTLNAFFALSQHKYSNNWVFTNRLAGGNLLTFNDDSLSISAIEVVDSRTIEANISMSDKEGNLLFYSNNCSVFNPFHEVIQDGAGMNPGDIQTYWCNVNPYANPTVNSIISLPSPNNPNEYTLFHLDFESFNVGSPQGVEYAPLHLYSTTIDMAANNGSGKVVSINHLEIEDTLNTCGLQAVRHGNGRDWWIFVPEYKSNCYYSLLYSPSGIEVVGKQCIGHTWDKYGLSGAAHFSPDGQKYIRTNAEYGLNIFDFNRCTGELSNPIHINLEEPQTYLISSASLSRSGRYLYYNTLDEIYQFDLESPNIEDSKTLVATYDGFISASNKTLFYHSELGPDGKIYICTYSATYCLHVIEQPDSAGLACNVQQHAITLPNRHYAAMPNYPNYDLGAMAGQCDTISATKDLNEAYDFSIYPNPSDGQINILFPGQTIKSIHIFDVAGNLVFQRFFTSSYENVSQLKTELLSGFYIVSVETLSGVRRNEKLVIK